MEEEEDNAIAFLDVFVTRQNDGTFTTKIYRKPSNTNIGLKPQSCQDPKWWHLSKVKSAVVTGSAHP